MTVPTITFRGGLLEVLRALELPAAPSRGAASSVARLLMVARNFLRFIGQFLSLCAGLDEPFSCINVERNCTEALSIQASVTISGSSARLIKNGIAPLPFPLPALLKQYWYIKRGERVRVRGHAPFYATLGFTPIAGRHKLFAARDRLSDTCPETF